MPDSRDKNLSVDMRISDDDIYEAMKDIPGYLDITPGDFKAVYQLACQHTLNRITRSIHAKDIMTKEVFSVNPDTPLKEVAELMGKHGVAGLPVVDEHTRVVGVISERDFLSKMGDSTTKNFMILIAYCLSNKGCLAIPVRAQKAADIMTTPAISVKEDATVLQINTIFKEKQINRVPVEDRNGCLQGIVTRADILNISLNIER
jgi:CBS domain-containing membrane protein